MTDQDIDLIANDGYRNVAGGIYATSVHEFARAIEQASRRAALEEAWEAVHGERLEEPTETHGDMAYERAVEDCENAVRLLITKETNNE